MPWCPKCKAEFREGITTICNDCNVELVDELLVEADLVSIYGTELEDIANRLVAYLNYSEMNATVAFDKENQMYMIAVPTKQQKKAEKLASAFRLVEQENAMQDSTSMEVDTVSSNDEDSVSSDNNSVSSDVVDTVSSFEGDDEYPLEEEDIEDTTEESELEEENSTTYIMKADQYSDLKSTVWIFLLFGVVGLIVVLLNIVGILTFLNGVLPNTVMGILFLVFIYIGLSSQQKAKKVQPEIDIEIQLTKDINNWLKSNVTEAFLASHHDENLSDELNFLLKIAAIKKLIITNFGTQNSSYLDRIIEEFYNETFDK